MRTDRVSQDFTNSRLTMQTPRQKSKSPILQRRSISPLRTRQQPLRLRQQQMASSRLSASPLRIPLQQAISRCLRPSQASRRLNNPQQSTTTTSIIQNIKKLSHEDQINNKALKGHPQTIKFIKKYFQMGYLIQTEEFITRILKEYGGFWDHQNLEQLLEDFTYKVNQIFGVDGIDPRVLILKTKNDGMLGLIMTIFKQLKQQQSTRNSTYTSFSRNPQVMSINKSFQQRLYMQPSPSSLSIQNIKNILQQFMQSMYQCMEQEIYNKFNIEMRRMVLKYREAEKIIKKVNQKINVNVDFFQLEARMNKQKRSFQDKVKQLQRKIERQAQQINKEKQSNNQCKNSKSKLQQQNRKLKQSMQKLQNALISKALQPSQKQLPPSRYNPVPFTQRTSQYLNHSTNPQPFQIKIDTHIIQKQPTTFTTFPHMINSNIGSNMGYSHSPMKENFQTSRVYYGQQGQQGLQAQSRFTTAGGTNGVQRMY